MQPADLRSGWNMHERCAQGGSIMSYDKKRYTGDELHARMIFGVAIILAVVFAITVIGFVYALMFVTQPIGQQSPNDSAFIDLLKTLTVFLTGSLGGLVMSNGMKSKKPDEPRNEGGTFNYPENQ